MNKLILFVFDALFGCKHENYTWPITTKDGTHVSCLSCGKTLPYDFASLGDKQLPAPKVTAPRQWVLDTPGHIVCAMIAPGKVAFDIEVRQ